MRERRSIPKHDMGAMFALWMVMILVLLALALFVLKRNHPKPEPPGPWHESTHNLSLWKRVNPVVMNYD